MYYDASDIVDGHIASLRQALSHLPLLEQAHWLYLASVRLQNLGAQASEVGRYETGQEMRGYTVEQPLVVEVLQVGGSCSH